MAFTTLLALIMAIPSPQGAPAAAPAGASASMKLITLQTDLNALNSMQASAAQNITYTQYRIEAMDAFMKEKKIDGGYADFAATAKVPVPSLSFVRAYGEAVEAEEQHGDLTPSTQDVNLLEREVSATTTLAQETWSKLSDLMQQVAIRTAYFQNKNVFKDYQEWAPNYNQARREAEQKAEQQKRASAIEADKQRSANVQAHLDSVRAQWEKLAYKCSYIDYNEYFSQSGSGTFGDPRGDNYYEQGPYANGFGPYAYGYYGGSSWNTYNDPYHDYYGYPSGGNVNDVNVYNPNGFRRDWNRNAGAAGGANFGAVGGGAGGGGAGAGGGDRSGGGRAGGAGR